MDEIVKRMVAFVESVCFVTRYAIWVGRMSSPLGANVYHCVTGVARTLTAFCILHWLPLASVFDVPYLAMMCEELIC